MTLQLFDTSLHSHTIGVDVLGYPSKDAFRQAIARKTTPIPAFGIEKRRGKFAMTKDVAAWIAAQSERATAPTQWRKPS